MTVKDIFKRLVYLFNDCSVDFLKDNNEVKRAIINELGTDEYVRITMNDDVLILARKWFEEETGKAIALPN